MTVTVFTCVVGRTDPLRRPTVVARGVRYVCFSDRANSPAPYVHVPIQATSGLASQRLLARQIKICADMPELGDADVLLWHDAAFQMGCDPLDVAERHLSDQLDIVAFKHPDRGRIEDEAVAIDKFNYVPLPQMLAQISAYRSDGFAQESAITSTGFCVRRRTPSVEAFNRRWWSEVEQWGWRDQMSVDYALWKTGIRAGYLPGHYRDNPYARWFKN